MPNIQSDDDHALRLLSVTAWPTQAKHVAPWTGLPSRSDARASPEAGGASHSDCRCSNLRIRHSCDGLPQHDGCSWPLRILPEQPSAKCPCCKPCSDPCIPPHLLAVGGKRIPFGIHLTPRARPSGTAARSPPFARHPGSAPGGLLADGLLGAPSSKPSSTRPLTCHAVRARSPERPLRGRGRPAAGMPASQGSDSLPVTRCPDRPCPIC